jgi:hypothetical protein
MFNEMTYNQINQVREWDYINYKIVSVGTKVCAGILVLLIVLAVV